MSYSFNRSVLFFYFSDAAMKEKIGTILKHTLPGPPANLHDSLTDISKIPASCLWGGYTLKYPQQSDTHFR